jgi:hypothetical protein
MVVVFVPRLRYVTDQSIHSGRGWLFAVSFVRALSNDDKSIQPV